MPIILHLDDLLAERNVSVTELAQAAGITRANMSNIKTGKVRAIRFSTLEAMCDYLDCQPGDIIEYVRE
ncbi:MAG: helix-turn-helix domain-containing protein [Coriobacteriales bacterium]